LQIAIYRDFYQKNGLTQTSCKSVPGGLEPQGLQEAAVEKNDLVLKNWSMNFSPSALWYPRMWTKMTSF